jgi:hypothetical protein
VRQLRTLAGDGHSLIARDLLTYGRKWLARFTPFFNEQERKQAGCQHRLLFTEKFIHALGQGRLKAPRNETESPLPCL